jgi:hypothetical protein
VFSGQRFLTRPRARCSDYRRERRMARVSELSDRAVKFETIDRLFARFRSDMFNCLLLLNSSYRRSTNAPASSSSRMRCCGGDRSVARGTGGVRRFRLILRNVGRRREVVYRIRLSDNQGHFEVWSIARRFGFDAETFRRLSWTDFDVTN